MENIIAHRGFWLEQSEQNTGEAFKRALSSGFGIETDLRDRNESIVISHDMANSACMSFDEFLSICDGYSTKLILAFNIKVDGLQKILNKTTITNDHFFFDMSVPDMIGYKKNFLNLYTRYSDIETKPSLYADSKGVWLDNFCDAELDVEALQRFIDDDKKIVLVSPELHKRDECNYWYSLKEYLSLNPQYKPLIGLCTDFPQKARDFFNDK